MTESVPKYCREKPSVMRGSCAGSRGMMSASDNSRGSSVCGQRVRCEYCAHRITSITNGAPHWSSSSIPTVDAQRPGPQAEVMAPWPRAANVVAVAVASPCGERHGVPRGLKTAENGHGGASRRFRRDSRPLRKSQGVGPVSRGFLGPFVGSVRPWPAKKNGRAGPYRLERGCARGAFKFVVKITTV